MTDKARYEFGQHLAALRRRYWLTQDQLADMAALKPATVKNIEEGAFNVPFDVLNRLAVCLGGELRIVLNDEENGE